MHRFVFALFVLPLFALSACPEQNAVEIKDAGPQLTRDADYANDVVMAQDAAHADDAALPDQGTGDQGLADSSTSDTFVAHDSALPDSNAGEEDAGLPAQGENIFVSGSFEHWQDGLPLGWMGDKTTMTTDNIAEEDGRFHDGQKSCRIVVQSDSHERLTTAPMSLRAGRYHCSYWVWGGGEIRTARYDGSFSSYGNYHVMSEQNWQQLRYDFTLNDDVDDVFELIFSVRNTQVAFGDLLLDDVRCTRDIEPCDSIECADWQVCDNAQAACVSADGFCADAGECQDWQDCDTDHTCVVAAGHCADTSECSGDTPICDSDTHVCISGDTCAGVDCGDEWRSCNPDTGNCRLTPGRCLDTGDCQLDLPVCDILTHNCVAIDDSTNIVPNGGFEVWEDFALNGSSVNTVHLPVSWYGVCDGCSPYYPDSEAAFDSIVEYTSNTHGGDKALQLIKTGRPADRFESEPFSLTPTTTYNCAYWLRGKGSYKVRGYCGGWLPDSDFASIDSEDWQQQTFDINSNSAWCVLIFYISDTDPNRDHVQIDDVSCSQKFSW